MSTGALHNAPVPPEGLESPAGEIPSPLAGLKVLVVGINYEPEHTGIAPYTTKACEHLDSLGAQVQVLTGVPHYPHWSTPAEYRRRLTVEERRRGVAVRRLRHYVPSRQSVGRRGLYEATFGASVLGQRLPWEPDVVLAVIPSLAGAAAASVIAKRHGARLVLWVQDLMGPATAQSGMNNGRRISRATGALEAGCLRRADRVLVLNEGFRGYVEQAGVAPERVQVLRNWSHVEPHRGNRAATRARLGWSDEQVVALHTGNMGLKQGLENVVHAARLAQAWQPHVKFVLMGDGSQRGQLEELGRDVQTLSFLPPCSSEDYPDFLAAADVLLVNERETVIEMSLPSKLTSYFQAGGPVLAAVRPEGSTAREVHLSAAGMVIAPNDPQALLDATLQLGQPGDRAVYAHNARRHVARHLGADAAMTGLAAALLGD